jgi:hypothetical protein
MDPPTSAWFLAALAVLWLTPALARGQAATTGDARESEPRWSWPAGPRTLQLGLAPPEEPGEPLTAVAVEALTRWGALDAVVALSASRALALETATTVGAHASVAWGDGMVRPLLDLQVGWSLDSRAETQPLAVRGGPALVAQLPGPHSFLAASSYATDAREVRVDVVYELAVDAGM